MCRPISLLLPGLLRPLVCLLALSGVLQAAPGGAGAASEAELALRRVLTVFDGTWSGSVTIKSLDGAVLRRCEARRTVRWDGYTQVVETRIELGPGDHVTTRRQTVAGGVLKAAVGRPRQPAGVLLGEAGESGVSWQDPSHPRHEYIERVAVQGGRRALELLSREPLQAGGISGMVRIEGLLWREDAAGGAADVAVEEPAPLPVAAGAPDPDEGDLRARLAALEAELARLRTAGAESAVPAEDIQAVAEPAAPATSGLRIASEPAGAEVEVDGVPVGRTPLTVLGLAPGRRAVRVALAHHEARTLEVEAPAGGQADAGVVALAPLRGGIAIETDPAGVVCRVRSDGPMATGAVFERAGATPLRWADLPVGRYVVTTQREGWPAQETVVLVEAGRVVEVSHRHAGAVVVIESSPAGAEVEIGGARADTTPLVLEDVRPGEFRAKIARRGFHAREIRAMIEPGWPVTVRAELDALEYFARASELDVPPMPIATEAPEPVAIDAPAGSTAHVAVIVGMDGVPRQAVIVRADDAAFGQRCLRAVVKWRFKPGIVEGQPVAVRVVVPFEVR